MEHSDALTRRPGELLPAETHTHRNPIDRDAVVAIVTERAADVAGVDPDGVDETTSFTELGIDTMGLLELAEAIEDELGERTVGLQIDDDDLVELRSVGETVDYVLRRLG
jgi:acyl carrier protein